MKNKVFIMVLSVIVLIGIGLFIFLIVKKENTDAKKFKREYELLNNKVSVDNEKYINVSVDKENPIVYVDASDIVSMIENNESFVVYFGYSKSNKCRGIIEDLLKAAKDSKLEKLYYVDIENIRDELVINVAGEFETIYAGTDAYYELLKLLNNVLNDYELTNSKGKKVSNEKRIFEPSIISIVNGNAVELTDGSNDAHKNIKDVISIVANNSCNEAC